MNMDRLKTEMILSLIGICLFFCVENAFGQSKTTMELLINKEWVMQFPSKQSYSSKIIYDKNEEKSILTINNEEYPLISSYYLSNEFITKFDFTKVGKISNGKYIVTYRETVNKEGIKCTAFQLYEIMNLNASNLVLKNMENNSILTYKCE